MKLINPAEFIGSDEVIHIMYPSRMALNMSYNRLKNTTLNQTLVRYGTFIYDL